MIFIILFGGLSLLLFGVKLLNDGLRNAAGVRIRALLQSLTSNRFSAVGVGAFITGLIQSSSATSVMLVGFVSAGLMSFRQTLGVILGADIGATLTVQLIAFHIQDYSLLLVGAGISLILFSKRRLWNNLGESILGFGFIFFSLKIMVDAMQPLQSNELFRQLFIALTGTPLAGIVLAAVVTVLIHNSAATIGIALALAQGGIIPLSSAIYIVLGANIGTCGTAVLASLHSPADARRVAWAHVSFKVIGVALFLPFLDQFREIIAAGATDISRQIANAHSIFNIVMAAVLLPFTGLFAKALMKLVPEDPEEKKFGPMYLDKHVLGTPALALGQASREALRASDIVREMLADLLAVFRCNDPARVDELKNKDNMVDILDRHIRLYISQLSAAPLTESQTRRTLTVLEMSRNMESIGDIIDRNIMPLALKQITKGSAFSREGMDEIVMFHKRVLENFDLAVSAFTTNDRDLADRVLRNKEEMTALERDLVQAHLDRLRRGYRESIETSHVHLDLIGNLARINSLITHVIYPIVEEKRGRGREDMGIA